MVDKERLNSSLDYIKVNYNISSLLKEWGYTINKKSIACPLHSDITPSCSIDIENNRYHCFSCGSYGSYVNLLHEYLTKVKGVKKTFSQVVDDIIKNDDKMQQVLGFNTVYIKEIETYSIDNYLDMKYKLYEPKYINTFSNMRILNCIKNDINDVLDFFACIEKDYPQSMIYDKFVNHLEVIPITTINEIQQHGQELRDLLGISEESGISEVIDNVTGEFNEYE
jgi:hypothetical protein